MCELSRLLNALKIDGQPLACEHAVLISESGSEAPRDWVISILGVRPIDFDRVIASRTFSATGSQGEGYNGGVRSAPGSSSWHVRLQGRGPLHRLREVRAHGDDAGSEGDALELAALHAERAAAFDLEES